MPTLDWIGKRAVVNHHRELPYRLLHCDRDASAGEPGGGNLLVEGDNLHALKALLPYYAGKVKCIYIDPPYNTGNEGWVYNDNVNAPEIQKWLGETVGKEAEDLSRHDKWLCMMYPRLALLCEFLREDGSIWISIDDNEIAALRLLMNEIFGPHRFVASNVWQKRYSRENREAIGDVHEYVVVYAKNPQRFKEVRNRVPLTEQQAKIYKNPNGDPKGRFRTIPMTAQGYRPNQMYEITTPTGVVHKPPEGRCWSMIEPEYLKLKAEGKIYFGKTGNSQPSVVRYLSEVDGLVPWTWWPHEEVGHTDESRKEIQAILGTQTAFETPKPKRLLKRILQVATNPGDIILDSFAGSGTTGHAALELNAEQEPEKPRRQFILVQLPYESEDQRKHDRNIATEVTAERLKRVINGYGETAGLSGSFRYCTLGEPLFDAEGRMREDVKWGDLAHHLWFAETGEPWSTSHQLHDEEQNLSTGGPLIGITSEGRAIYLLFRSISQGVQRNGATTLSSDTVDSLAAYAGPRVVYADACTLRASALSRERIAFKQIPYQIRQQ